MGGMVQNILVHRAHASRLHPCGLILLIHLQHPVHVGCHSQHNTPADRFYTKGHRGAATVSIDRYFLVMAVGHDFQDLPLVFGMNNRPGHMRDIPSSKFHGLFDGLTMAVFYPVKQIKHYIFAAHQANKPVYLFLGKPGLNGDGYGITTLVFFLFKIRIVHAQSFFQHGIPGITGMSKPVRRPHFENSAVGTFFRRLLTPIRDKFSFSFHNQSQVSISVHCDPEPQRQCRSQIFQYPHAVSV